MTDWNLIRKLTNAAIDACETVERLGVTEENRGDTFTKDGEVSSTMWDYLQSAWTYPENLTYAVVRARHELGNDNPYTKEIARTLLHTGRLAAELVDAKDLRTKVSGVDPFRPEASESIEEMILRLCDWYKNHFTSGIKAIMKKEK